MIWGARVPPERDWSEKQKLSFGQDNNDLAARLQNEGFGLANVRLSQLITRSAVQSRPGEPDKSRGL